MGRELAAAAVLEIERPDPQLRHCQGKLLARALETTWIRERVPKSVLLQVNLGRWQSTRAPA